MEENEITGIIIFALIENFIGIGIAINGLYAGIRLVEVLGTDLVTADVFLYILQLGCLSLLLAAILLAYTCSCISKWRKKRKSRKQKAEELTTSGGNDHEGEV